MPFLTELLSWLGELVWSDEVGTVTYLELAMDFEAHAGRALPSAPQARFKGLSVPLQERGRGLRGCHPANLAEKGKNNGLVTCLSLCHVNEIRISLVSAGADGRRRARDL